MAIPKYDELMMPVLEVLSDEKEYRITEIVDILGKEYKLTEEELSAEIPSGGKLFYGHVGWAKTYLKAAKLIDSPKRAKKKAESVQGKIIRLIDGEELTKLMIKHNIGVQVKTKIEIKKLDGDFFTDEV